MSTPARNPTIGLVSALIMMFVWSGFIVFSRAGVTTGLTPYDVTALRFIVAGAITLPFCRAWWPGHLSLKANLLLCICGPGAVYTTLMFLGLVRASAAHAGVFSNGSLPIFAMLVTFIMLRETPNRRQVMAVLAIVCGGALLGISSMDEQRETLLAGIAFFLAASATLSLYMFGVRRWQLTPRQALAVVNLPNAAVYLPIWFLFLPSTLDSASTTSVLGQALFQGLGPGFLAVILFSLATLHLGPALTAGFAASVPALAALLAIPVLSEMPSRDAWLGIGIVTAGLLLLGLAARSPASDRRQS